MRCKSPVNFDRSRPDAVYPCGQCMHCRINQRRIWRHRLALESIQYESNAFLTLTYDDEHLPSDEFVHPATGEVFAPYSVSPLEHQLFIKKLRFHFRKAFGRTFRFYGVGEYGDRSWRPHYHYALFDFPRCKGPGPRRIGHRFYPCNCRICQFIADVWGKGHIYMGDLTLDSAEYICGYVCKKLTSNKSEYQAEILQGRHPEFARMSNRPGIAAFAADRIISALTSYNMLNQTSVPGVLMHGSKALPLGRYLLGKVNEKLPDPVSSSRKLRLHEAAVRSLLTRPQIDSQVTDALRLGASPWLALQVLNAQKCLSIEKKLAMYNQKKEKVL